MEFPFFISFLRRSKPKVFFFYPKIKGELEKAVKKLPFKKIHIFQPPILIRQPELIRSGEKIGIIVFTVLNKIGF